MKAGASSQRYDILFDIGANRSSADCRKVLTPNGKMLMIGAPSAVGALAARMIEMLTPTRRTIT